MSCGVDCVGAFDELAQLPVARRPQRDRRKNFGEARTWASAHNVVLVELSQGYTSDEPEPRTLNIYFRFNDEVPRAPVAFPMMLGAELAIRRGAAVASGCSPLRRSVMSSPGRYVQALSFRWLIDLLFERQALALPNFLPMTAFRSVSLPTAR